MKIKWKDFLANNIGQKAKFIDPLVGFEIDVIIKRSRVDFNKEGIFDKKKNITCFIDFESTTSVFSKLTGNDYKKIEKIKYGDPSILRYGKINIDCRNTGVRQEYRSTGGYIEGGWRISMDKETFLTRDIGWEEKESKKDLNRFEMLDIE